LFWYNNFESSGERNDFRRALFPCSWNPFDQETFGIELLISENIESAIDATASHQAVLACIVLGVIAADLGEPGRLPSGEYVLVDGIVL